MHSNATTVDDYMHEVPAERQEVLQRLRALCQASLAGYEETMEDGMPAYKKDGEKMVAFSSQAHHIAFYVCNPAVQAIHEAELSDVDSGMVQFNKADDVDFELIQKLLHDTARS